MVRLLFIIFISVLSVTEALAAPQISGINGTFTDNETVTITGYNFGAKSQAGPRISSYDNPIEANNISNGTISGEWGTRGGTTLGSSSSYRRTRDAYYIQCPYDASDYSQLKYDGSLSLGNYFVSVQ